MRNSHEDFAWGLLIKVGWRIWYVPFFIRLTILHYMYPNPMFSFYFASDGPARVKGRTPQNCPTKEMSEVNTRTKHECMRDRWVLMSKRMNNWSRRNSGGQLGRERERDEDNPTNPTHSQRASKSNRKCRERWDGGERDLLHRSRKSESMLTDSSRNAAFQKHGIWNAAF